MIHLKGAAKYDLPRALKWLGPALQVSSHLTVKVNSSLGHDHNGYGIMVCFVGTNRIDLFVSTTLTNANTFMMHKQFMLFMDSCFVHGAKLFCWNVIRAKHVMNVEYFSISVKQSKKHFVYLRSHKNCFLLPLNFKGKGKQFLLKVPEEISRRPNDALQ